MDERDPEHTLLYEAQTAKGRILLFDEHIVIDHDYGRTYTTGGTKEIPLDDIIRVNISETGPHTDGYISIIEAGHPRRPTNFNEAARDMNSILFTNKYEDEMKELAKLIEYRQK